MASIAGNVHGVKAAAAEPAEPQTERYYPQLEGVEGIHPEVARAVRTLYDNVYQLRGDQQSAAAGVKGSTSASATGGTSQFTGELQGINIKAVTDPSSLKDGMVPKYNAKTGQFEFSLP